MYKLRLKNESGVFESIARVDIEGPPGRAKKVEEKVEEVKVNTNCGYVFSTLMNFIFILKKNIDNLFTLSVWIIFFGFCLSPTNNKIFLQYF